MSCSVIIVMYVICEMWDFFFVNVIDYDVVCVGFVWFCVDEFNFVFEWFDVVVVENFDCLVVQIVEVDLSLWLWIYGELFVWFDQVVMWLCSFGIWCGDYVIVMLNNMIELWEVMLVIMKFGVVLIFILIFLLVVDFVYCVEYGCVCVVVMLGVLVDCIDGLD